MSGKANTLYTVNPTAINPGWQAITQGAVQPITYTGTAGLSAAVGVSTTLVRLVSSSDCFVLIGAAPVATSSNGSLLPAGVVEYFGITPGQKVSVVQSSASGTLNITEGAG